jgi:hypothetical protein
MDTLAGRAGWQVKRKKANLITVMLKGQFDPKEIFQG